MQIVNTKLPHGNIQTYQPQMINILGGGGKLPNANFEHQTTKWKYPNPPTTNDQYSGGGVNGQMQIVNTKLPNGNIQTYQPQMIDSGGGVNYQMEIVIKLPNGTTKVAQNDSEQQILPNSQLF